MTSSCKRKGHYFSAKTRRSAAVATPSASGSNSLAMMTVVRGQFVWRTLEGYTSPPPAPALSPPPPGATAHGIHQSTPPSAGFVLCHSTSSSFAESRIILPLLNTNADAAWERRADYQRRGGNKKREDIRNTPAEGTLAFFSSSITRTLV